MHEMHFTRFDFLIYLIHNFRDSIADALQPPSKSSISEVCVPMLQVWL